MDMIEENCTVILQKGRVLKAEKLVKGKKVVFEKLHFVPDNALGQFYNTWFRVSSNGLEKVENHAPDSSEERNDGPAVVKNECVEDNRSLDDTHGKSQSLLREEIVGMKTSGAKGEDIVTEIVKNSSTFSSKTTFSQKKYLKKKQKKHMTNIRILKPTSRLLSRMYESREPAKISNMRIDTLSQILTAANIHHGSKVAVVETCSGLLLSLLMERLAGCGAVINLHTGETPTNFHAIRHMNYSEDFWSVLHSLPLCKVGPLLSNKPFEEVVGEIPNEPTLTSEKSDKRSTQLLSELSKKDKKVELTEEQKCMIRMERKRKRLCHQHSAWETLRSKNLDAIVLACRFHPTPILIALLEFLAPSRPFVVHCENKEPLMDLFVQLTSSNKALNLKISETFMRQYQVLPEQTHPFVTMSTSGGYLLTGTKVTSCSASTVGKIFDEEIEAKRTKLK